jgi:hypothetical protein
LCGLAGKTVSRLRNDTDVSRPLKSTVEDKVRIGSDGRTRNIRSGNARKRALVALEDNPTGTLRSIARKAGVSPETVRAARTYVPHQALLAESDLDSGTTKVSRVFGGVIREQSELQQCQDDSAFSTGSAASFAAWFDDTATEDAWKDKTSLVPLSRIYEVATEARRRARFWEDFAKMLDARACRSLAVPRDTDP